MLNYKLKAGVTFPSIILPTLAGEQVELGAPRDGYDWKLVLVYRGMHCPICTSYLQELNAVLPRFHQLGVDVIAVSADTEARAQIQMARVNPEFPVAYDMSIEQMETLGLYISKPRSEQESNRPFSEPGLFVINHEGKTQLVDIANAPFLRPSLEGLAGGISFIRNPGNHYPIRGTFEAA